MAEMESPQAGIGGQAVPGRTQPIDVWTHTDARYRGRAIVLLVVNFLLFCGLCIFTHWLHFARMFDFSLEGYLAPARVTGYKVQNLNDFVLYPISVIDVPVHGVVLGLLVAAMVAVPILIAMLYRFPCALPFVAAVLVFAHMPWLAATLLIACTVASLPPFRMRFRYGSALLAMTGVLVYLFLATRPTPEQMAAFPSPDERSRLAAPWILAILGACVMMAAALGIARLVRYRPGVVAVALGVMFAAPVILFYQYVGADELGYRVLESQYGPLSRRFAPIKDPSEAEQALFEAFRDLTTDNATPAMDAFRELWAGDIEVLKQRIWRRLMLELMVEREKAAAACRAFIADHPKSRHVPAALYIEAWVLDTRLDLRSIARNPPRRELYHDFPSPRSENAWSTLFKDYGDQAVALPAGLRLAQLALRRGEIESALSYLEETLRRFDLFERHPSPTARRAAPNLEIDTRSYLFEVRRLHELAALNRTDGSLGAEALMNWARLDPHRPAHSTALLRLAQRYPNSVFLDNLIVAAANAASRPEQRAAWLERCLETFPTGDAQAEALFWLADLESQALAADAARRERGIARFRALVERFPSTCWALAAARRLEILAPPAQLAGAVP